MLLFGLVDLVETILLNFKRDIFLLAKVKHGLHIWLLSDTKIVHKGWRDWQIKIILGIYSLTSFDYRYGSWPRILKYAPLFHPCSR